MLQLLYKVFSVLIFDKFMRFKRLENFKNQNKCKLYSKKEKTYQRAVFEFY